MVTDFFALVESAWQSVKPVFEQLWMMVTTDPMSALVGLVIIGIVVWVYQESVRLGR